MNNSDGTNPDGVPRTACPVCETDVPAGAFCGYCGSHLTSHRGDGPAWLRLRTYSAASGEHVLRPSVTSTLFPHLHHRAQGPFRVGLIILLIKVFAKDFVVPVMAIDKVGVLEAWRRVFETLKGDALAFAGYIGMKILLAIGAGIIFGILGAIVVVVVSIPIGIVAVVFVSGGGGGGGGVVTVTVVEAVTLPPAPVAERV